MSAPAHQNLEVDQEALTGFIHVCCPDILNNTLLSQGSILRNSFHCEKSGQNSTFQEQGRGWGALYAQVQLNGQLAIMSSQWPPPTVRSIFIC